MGNPRGALFLAGDSIGYEQNDNIFPMVWYLMPKPVTRTYAA